MGAGIGAVGNAVAVDVEIAAEIAAGLQLLRRHHLAAVHGMGVVPGKGRAEMLVHADIEIKHDEDRRLQPVGQVEGERRKGEGLVRVAREQQHMFGVAMGGIGGDQDVGLLGARRHAGRGPAALHVEQHGRDLGEIGKAEKFLHQGNAGPGGRREGARAVPGRPHHHADGGELVLGLDDGEFFPPGLGVDTQPAAIALEGLSERGRRGNWIPRTDRRAAIDGAEAGRGIALHEDAVADAVGPAHEQADRTGEMRLGIIVADRQCLEIRLDQLVLALELLADQRLDDADLDVEKGGESADIDDVLEQLALARVGIFAVDDIGQRHADDGDVVAQLRGRHGP